MITDDQAFLLWGKAFEIATEDEKMAMIGEMYGYGDDLLSGLLFLQRGGLLPPMRVPEFTVSKRVLRRWMEQNGNPSASTTDGAGELKRNPDPAW